MRTMQWILWGAAVAQIAGCGGAPASPNYAAPQLALGAYVADFGDDPDAPDVVARQLDGLSILAGKPHSIAGLFLDLLDPNPSYNLAMPLDEVADRGYTPFLNLTTDLSLEEIDSGAYDDHIVALGQVVALWAHDHPDHVALIAPLIEMDDPVRPYAGEPRAFGRAYTRLRRLFAEGGVAAEHVRWVFAPAGGSGADVAFERYYPGDAAVDVVGFNSYNRSSCGDAAWRTPEEVVGPALRRAKRMAPSKPIMVTQAATSSVHRSAPDPSKKDEWLAEAYGMLASDPQVIGVVYFNIDEGCDWAVYRGDGDSAEGYARGAAHPRIGYIDPADMAFFIPTTP